MTTYVPAVVAGVEGGVECEPPHPPDTTQIAVTSRARTDSQRRRRTPRPMRNKAANVTAPPPERQRRSFEAAIADVPAVVLTVIVVVAFPPAVRVSVPGSKAHVGGLCAFAGDVVRAQLRFNVPE